MSKKKKKKVHFKRKMRVSIKTVDFDGSVPGSWSKGRPKLTFGTLLGWRKDGNATVLWEGEKLVDKKFNPNLHQLTPAPLSSMIITIMMALEVGSIPSYSPTDQSGAWPKNFLEALVRSDWRDWVMAVRKENSEWQSNDTTTEVGIEEVVQGASIIPLGELFTKKRDGSTKFRQYAMGNLLKPRKDFLDTFSTSVSADGIRWFCALAVTYGKVIWG